MYGQSPASQNVANDEWEKMMGLSNSGSSPGSTATYAPPHLATGGVQAPQQPTDADWDCLMGLNQPSVPPSAPSIVQNDPRSTRAPNYVSQEASSSTTQAFSEPQVQMIGRYAPSTTYESNAASPTHSHAHVPIEQRPPSSEYHFGDITKSIIAKGKKKAGRDDSSGYKFGDFSRGLFGR
jgi:hypothetical protein